MNEFDKDLFLIDGHNLALRCARTPSLAKLKDARGRSTGILHGFLRSILSFRTLGAELVVVWDGRCTWKKDLFPGYKANRMPMPLMVGWDPIGWLQATLPLIGVPQASHPTEEADDVLATLASSSDRRLTRIVSTDRDLLQIVSDAVCVLVPPPRAKDQPMQAFYPVTVEDHYGVTPDQMVDLRALTGDVSDNLTGVRGLGLVRAAKLVRTCGSVEGIYAAFDGGRLVATKAQKQRLEEARARVFQNMVLMRLRRDLPVTLVAPQPYQGGFLVRLRSAGLAKVEREFLLGTSRAPDWSQLPLF